MKTLYDPLVSDGPGSNKGPIDSYWFHTAGDAPANDGALTNDIDVDVAIIGGGYTGLVSAYYLTKEYGLNVAVLEANHPGWGCSGRNGGFIRSSIGKLGYNVVIKKYGLDMARRIYQEADEAVNELLGLIEREQIDCDVKRGYLKIAHNKETFEGLIAEAKLLKKTFGYECEIVNGTELKNRFVNSDEGYGALFHPTYFGLHPLKLVYGYLRAARAQGAKVYSNTEVKEIIPNNNGVLLRTNQSSVRAKKVIIATNGYTPEHLHPELKGTIMPVLSQIAVTRPLTEKELSECGFKGNFLAIDTRKINRYYRLLPDNRLLLGSRGAHNESPSEQERQKGALLRDIKQKFSPLVDVTADYTWSGWVGLTADWMPHVGTTQANPNIIYALGYGGSGISYSARAGRLAASLVAGNRLGPDVNEITAKRLPKYKFAFGRRLGRYIALSWIDYADKKSSR